MLSCKCSIKLLEKSKFLLVQGDFGKIIATTILWGEEFGCTSLMSLVIYSNTSLPLISVQGLV